MKFLKGRKGFTLIELLIVITIIGVLAVALVPRIVGAPAKARDAARKADLQQIATGLELYADSNNGTYPAATIKCVSTISGALLDGYLTTVPEDPQGLGGSPTCSGGYAYRPTSNGFILSAQLETASASDSTTNVFGAETVVATDTTAANLPFTATCNGGSTPSGKCYYYVAR